jgi:aspartate racemase
VRDHGIVIGRIGSPGGMSWESSAAYDRLSTGATRERLGHLHSGDGPLRSVDFVVIEQLLGSATRDPARARSAADGRALAAGGARLCPRCSRAMRKLRPARAGAVDVPFVRIAEAAAAALRSHGSRSIGMPATARMVVRTRFVRTPNHPPELERAAHGR